MTQLLRNTNTGVIFTWSKELAEQSWMVPYKSGESTEQAAEPEVLEVISEEAPVEVKTLLWSAEKKDGPVYRSLIKMANRKEITLDNIDRFNPSPEDFREKYSVMAVKSAVSEFKARSLNGE